MLADGFRVPSAAFAGLAFHRAGRLRAEAKAKDDAKNKRRMIENAVRAGAQMKESCKCKGARKSNN